MARDIVYFDLETQKSANDVGGWGNKDQMGMSIGVTYSTGQGKYIVYGEGQVEKLIDQLRRADLVIGFNHIHFDYEVLMGYTILNLKEQIPSLDLMVDLEGPLGHRPKLEAVASASLGTGKTAVGTDAIKWWREGKIMQIAEYCAYDVKVTRMVHEYGARNGFVKYVNRFNQEQDIPVNWTLD
ncbi:MAG: helicase [Verrucomicrobiae bacterium]|nr:helicase [Verrucomicrobiae bacterium]MCP5539196.1 helicase [Akkermansiaceae bacterium]MCP5549847.1 helicase [Akkermansiaceae bacterium]